MDYSIIKNEPLLDICDIVILTCLTELPSISRGTDTEEVLATPGLTGGSTMTGVAAVTRTAGSLAPCPSPPGTTEAEIRV